MSLNGLDASPINEAYAASLGKAGGWLLLKYMSRDEVELLQAGGNGASEARDAVTHYDEISPLFGFLQFRRKKVLLKYVPEGTSRLLQGDCRVHFEIKLFADKGAIARLTVHFEAIADRFPHDAILSLSTPLELNDNTISASLHSVLRSASIKSSTSSLRKPPLEEITEDSGEVDEHERVATATDVSTVKDNHQNAVSTPRQSLSRNNSVSSSRRRGLRSLSSSSRHRQAENNVQSALVQSAEEKIVGTNRSAYETGPERPLPERRRSSQSTRPSLRESIDSFSHQKKIKLGPRPSVDNGDRRSGKPPLLSHNSEPRQVSALPASVRIPARHPTPPKPFVQSPFQTQRSVSNATMASLSQSDPVELDGSERPPSSGSVVSVVTHNKGHGSKPPTLSPEKQRLKKALQIRQRRLEMRPLQSPKLDESPRSDTHPTKTADEQTALDAFHDRSMVDADTGVVHVFAKDIADVSNPNHETSPISTTEPSDGPSTKASSVADVEETKPDDDKSRHSDHEDESIQASINPSLTIAPTELDPPSEPSSTKTIRNPVDANLSPRPNSPSQIPLPNTHSDEVALLKQDPDLNKARQGPSVISVIVDSEPTNPSSNPIGLEADVRKAAPNARSSSRGTFSSRGSDRVEKQRGSIDPIKVAQSEDTSDDNYLSDEAFMEELQSATVQQAKPMSVSRSPITPVFPKSSTKSTGDRSSAELSRTISNNPTQSPELRRHLTPDMSDRSLVMEGDETRKLLPVARAVSSPLRNVQQRELTRTLSPPLSPPSKRRSVSVSPSREPERSESPMPLLKKIGVSSGISQRIKALEKFSSTPESATSSKHTTPNISPTIVSQRKTSINTPTAITTSPPPQTGWSFRRKVPYPTPSPSPHTARTFSSKLSPTPTTAPTSTKKFVVEGPAATKKSQVNTISVTARIIRDNPHETPEIPLNPSEPAPLHLHQSPLIVEHTNTAPEPSPSITTPSPMRSSKPSRSPSVNSLSASTSPDSRRDAAPPALRRNSTNSRLSGNSRKNSDVDRPRPLSETSSTGTPSTDKSEEKKQSRTSRLFKRMSSIGTASRRSIVHALSPTVKEEDPIQEYADAEEAVEEEEEVKSMDVGDVNVQFPDTLLWKRRHMELDGQGYLILERCKADDHSRVATKKYHMSDFRSPYIPDHDRQELPNSVILDFKDDSTLQFGCESIPNQARVLKALFDAYQSHQIR